VADVHDGRLAAREGGADRLADLMGALDPETRRAVELGGLVEGRAADIGADVAAAEEVALIGFLGSPAPRPSPRHRSSFRPVPVPGTAVRQGAARRARRTSE